MHEKDGIMRAPIFLRFRDDKSPEECLLEADQPLSSVEKSNGVPEETKRPTQLSSSLSHVQFDTGDFSNLREKRFHMAR